jgi:hypothetical protein
MQVVILKTHALQGCAISMDNQPIITTYLTVLALVTAVTP